MRQYTRQLIISGNPDTSGRFTYQLERSIDHIHRINVRKVLVPFSYYVFNSTNNQIGFDEGAGALTATISVGNYNANEIETELKTAFEAVGLDTYTVTIDPNNYLLTIASTGTFTLDFTVANSAFEYLGFDQTTYTPLSASWTSPHAVNLNGPLCLHLKSNAMAGGSRGRSIFNNREDTVFYTIDVGNDNPNQIIYSFSDKGSTIQYVQDRHMSDATKVNQNSKFGRKFKDIDIQIVDHNGSIDLNGRMICIIIDVVSFDD